MTEPLRIVLPIHSFEPGGVERVALNLADRWRQAGHEVVIVLGRDAGLDRPGAPVNLDYRTQRSPIPTARFETLWMIWCLLVHLTRHRADVIFCSGNTYTVVCVAMKFLLGPRCPPVLVKVSNDLLRHDLPAIHRYVYRLWLKLNGLLLERFVALAEPMTEEIVAGVGIGRHRVATIHDPALDGERCEALLARPRDRQFGRPMRYVVIGRLVTQKNLTMTLRAFAEGCRPGDHLTFVGEGPDRSMLEKLVCTLAMQGRVSFVGHVGNPDRYLGDADCLLLSSHYEGVPAVVIEAIAAGVPIIATDCCSSMLALLGNRARGVLIPPGDASAMARAIAHPERLPRPGSTERSYALTFTLERAFGRYVTEMRTAVAIAADARRNSYLQPDG